MLHNGWSVSSSNMTPIASYGTMCSKNYLCFFQMRTQR
jgi:hypothetical protein